MKEKEEEEGIFQSPDFPPTVTSLASTDKKKKKEMQKKMVTRREEEAIDYKLNSLCTEFKSISVYMCLSELEMKSVSGSCVVFIEVERLGN